MKGTVRRLLAATGTTVALGGTVAACAATTAAAAQPLPPRDAVVAKVGDQVRITRADVERWALAMRTSGISGSEEPAGAPLSAAERRDTLSMLLSLNLMLAEVRRLQLKLSFDVRGELRDFERGVRRLLPPPATDADRRLWLRGVAASTTLGRAAQARLPPLSDAAVERWWRRQKEPSWFTPRQVRADVVELRSEAVAREALAALSGGESFASVGARLSGSESDRYHGESHLFSAPPADFYLEESQPRLLRTLLKAAPGRLIGPLRDDGGWFVARVTEVVSTRARIPLAQVRTRVRNELDSQRSEDAFIGAYRAATRYWVPRTTCLRTYAPKGECGRVVAKPLR